MLAASQKHAVELVLATSEQEGKFEGGKVERKESASQGN